ncbi:ferredoxin-type protein NapH [Methanolinea mesophila]|uniref:4Fe-4S binding protein n=1 Tax=Methanolinea mesophila TaxID=547055 RepID=UPI001AE4F3C4|nr:ferredoxin-type protein NapH [Methanolinea mesophila]
MSLRNPVSTIRNNRWRYLALILGFFLFVGPFAVIARLAYGVTGNMASPTLHTMCYRMPIDWLFGGRWYALLGSVAAAFILGVVLIAFFVGPVFCGWLCPVGSLSECLSRITPLPDYYRIRIKDPLITKGLRYGFFAGFVAVSVIVGYRIASLSSVCCRYCTSSVLQNIANGLTGQLSSVSYWHTGSLIALISWLVIGGVLMSGGRGWCLFFCPLGVLSNLSHSAGKRAGMYRVFHNAERCQNCSQCEVFCPTWAISADKSVDSHLCIACQECTNACPHAAYEYGRKR